MKIGFYATGSATAGYQDLMEQVRFADDAGFDSVWLRERHFHRDHDGRNFFSSPFVAAAYMASITTRIRLGIGARLLPLDHPLHVAEAAATVDVISGGRLDLGVARIGENPLYQEAFGISAAETRDRFTEAIDVILSAWTTTTPLTHDGLYPVSGVCVEPRPVQRPHPPLHLVGISADTLAFGAARGLPLLMAAAQPVAILRKTQAAYRASLAQHGHADVVHPVNRFIYVADSDEEAIEDTRATIMGFMHRSNTVIREFMFLPDDQITYELLLREVCIFGSPDSCMAAIERLAGEIDLRNLVLTFNYFTIAHEKCLRSMKLFAQHLLPALRVR